MEDGIADPAEGWCVKCRVSETAWQVRDLARRLSCELKSAMGKCVHHHARKEQLAQIFHVDGFNIEV